MAWVATAIVGSATVGAGAQIYGAISGADVVSSASGNATAAELEMFYKSRKDTAPWRIAGREALGRLTDKVEAGPGEFSPEDDPGFKFGYNEFVEKPMVRGGAAGGFGGKFSKELTRYASDYASTKYDNFLDRWYKSLAPDQSIAGVGQTAASQASQNALATGRGIAGNKLTAGIARGSGYQNVANAVSQTAGGVGQNALDAYYMNKYMKPQTQTPAVTPNVTIT